MDNRTVPKGEVIIGKREGEAETGGGRNLEKRSRRGNRRGESRENRGREKEGSIGKTSGREWEIEEGKEDGASVKKIRRGIERGS